MALTPPDPAPLDGIDVAKLPRFISYRAALMKEKATYQTLLVTLLVVFFGYITLSRIEVHSLIGKLRKKEFILAPGVENFTAAAPQRVSDDYVDNAATDYLSKLGNIHPANISSQYQALGQAMSDSLRVRFQQEAQEWIDKVREDNVAEWMTIEHKDISSDEKGQYKVIAKVRVETMVNREFIGQRDEVIQMGLRLVPPSESRRWYLEITDLQRSSAQSYQVGKGLRR